MNQNLVLVTQASTSLPLTTCLERKYRNKTFFYKTPWQVAMDLEIHKISSYYLVFEFTRTFSKGEAGLGFNPERERGTRKQPAKLHKTYFPFWMYQSSLWLAHNSSARPAALSAAEATRGHSHQHHLHQTNPGHTAEREAGNGDCGCHPRTVRRR